MKYSSVVGPKVNVIGAGTIIILADLLVSFKVIIWKIYNCESLLGIQFTLITSLITGQQEDERSIYLDCGHVRLYTLGRYPILFEASWLHFSYSGLILRSLFSSEATLSGSVTVLAV